MSLLDGRLAYGLLPGERRALESLERQGVIQRHGNAFRVLEVPGLGDRPKSIREIATLLGHKGSGSARATLQRDLESGLEKLWQGLAAEVGFAGAARAVWQLIRTDPTFDPPKWLVEKLRRFRSELGEEVVEVSPPPALEDVRWWTAQKSTMSEKVFERELRAKGRVL